MSDISLLPIGYSRYKETRRKKSIYMMVTITIFSVIVLVYIMLLLLNHVYLQELEALRMEKSQVESRIGPIRKYEDVLASLKDYEQLINSTIGNTPEWKEILTDLSGTLPGGIWFDDVSIKNENNAVKCLIRGRATGQNAVAQWLDNIEGVSYMRNVSCRYINEISENNGIYLQFEASADLSGPEIPKREGKGVGK